MSRKRFNEQLLKMSECCAVYPKDNQDRDLAEFWFCRGVVCEKHESVKLLREAVEHIKKLKVEIYCLYHQANKERLDKVKDETCIVKRKATDAEQFLEKVENQ